MSAKEYQVRLSKAERTSLTAMTRKGRASARQLTRARILLLADQGYTDQHIADVLGTSLSTLQRIRRRFARDGVKAALQEKPRPGAPPKLNARAEAQLTALVCSPAPDGHARWTLRLLADTLVELKIVDSISHQGVSEYLKKTNSSPGNAGSGASRR